MDRVYWSNQLDESWSNNDNQVFSVLLLPKKWWKISHWMLAYQFNKGIEITGLSKRKDIKHTLLGDKDEN